MVCPKCQKVRRFKDTVVNDKKNKRKRWLIKSCITCDYHIDIEEYRPSVEIEEDD